MKEKRCDHYGRVTTLGRPLYGVIFPMGRPHELLTGPIFHSGNTRSLPPGHVWCPGKSFGPLSGALHAAGAILPEPYVFRISCSNYQMDCRLEARLGKDADGS